MNEKHILILYLFLSFSVEAFSQINCTVPQPPVLTAVSITPETGSTELSWSASPSDNIAGYIIYTYNDGNGFPVDTIWSPSARSYFLNSTASKYMSMSYVVTAHRLSAVPGMPGCTSPLSNALQTIFCSATVDSCNSKIKIIWNKYNDYPRRVSEYRILVSRNGSALSDTYTTVQSASSFEISGFSVNTDYCFAVKAVFDDGGFSTSNMTCINTSMQRPPEWINADYATINDQNSISLSFTVDPVSELSNFVLERKTEMDGSFQKIANPPIRNGNISYTDDKADINKVNYYRLTGLNGCNVPAKESNISSNMVLLHKNTGNEILLSWNPYIQWLGQVVSYEILINTGNGYETRLSVHSDTTCSIGVEDIMYEITGDQVCFRISASEAGNPYGIEGKSLSSVSCYEPSEIITVPDIFTPNNDMKNDYFRPVLSFTPLEYHLLISDRNGKVLFETRDYNSSWDGSSLTSHNQFVCLWFLRIKTPSGNKISKTGTVTIIR